MLWTVKKLSDVLCVKEPTLYLWVKQNKIPYIRMHSLIRFDPEAIAAWLTTFPNLRRSLPSNLSTRTDRSDIDTIIARVTREGYTPPHGETRPKSSLIRKEEEDGAV